MFKLGAENEADNKKTLQWYNVFYIYFFTQHNVHLTFTELTFTRYKM